MDAAASSWEDEFKWKRDPYYGCVSSLEEAKSIIDDFEYATCSSFSEIRSTKNFGRFDMSGIKKLCLSMLKY